MLQPKMQTPTPVRTVFVIDTTKFYYPHSSVLSDMVKRSDLGY